MNAVLGSVCRSRVPSLWFFVCSYFRANKVYRMYFCFPVRKRKNEAKGLELPQFPFLGTSVSGEVIELVSFTSLFFSFVLSSYYMGL